MGTTLFISILLVVVGATLLLTSIVLALRIKWRLEELRVRWRVSLYLLLFLFSGYIFLIMTLIEGLDFPIVPLTAATLSVGAAVVYIVILLIGNFSRRVEAYCDSLSRHTDELAREVGERLQAERRISLQENRLRHLAQYDMLTGLPNRTLLDDRLGQLIKAARRQGHKVGVLCLGLDRLKRINDTFGHAIGDRLIQCLAGRIQGCLRESDTVARLGGDELSVLLPHLRCDNDVALITGEIMEAVRLPFQVEDRELFVTASIGVALYPDDGVEAAILLKHADLALHRAKEQGANTCKLYSPVLQEKAVSRMSLEQDLRGALTRNELVLLYQPVVDLLSGLPVGVEALIRWQRPGLGLVPPMEFIPLAEETGLIVAIGAWVLQTACSQGRAWMSEGLSPVRIAINISPRQFIQPDLVSRIEAAMAETGIGPDQLEIEITESTIMHDLDHAVQVLTRLHDLGLQISIDDFGTGYSSLSYLKRFPIHTLKIDRSFVRDLAEDQDDSAIVTAVIAMAHSLKLRVVAEGVETEEQLRFLRSLGCDHAQGYLFSRPVSAQETQGYLSTRAFLPRVEAGGEKLILQR